ncbi:MAG: TetR/AcrR family transcriptional regulator [Myxococcaceae bacterium]|nr:TetR/AcrR family transcriptional regulator [Myxococcaceae bacterium]
MKPQSTSRDLQREQSRERLFHAALEIFRRDGFRAARVDDITLVAGLSRTSFYFHFPTKEDVLVELNRRLEEPVLAAVLALDETTAVPRLLELIAKGVAVQWQEHRAVVVDALTVGLRLESERSRAAREGTLRFALTRRFERAMASGVLSRIRPPEGMADAYLLHCLAAMASWGSGVDDDLEATLVAAGQMFLEGALVKAA